MRSPPASERGPTSSFRRSSSSCGSWPTSFGFIYHWDAYPFILLNLGFSAQASYAAPLILMASNRSTERDRMVLEHEANETDEIFKIQDTQIELLKAIKAETALLCQVIDSMGGRVPDLPSAPAAEPAG